MKLTTFQQAVDAMENLSGVCPVCGSIVQQGIKGNVVVKSIGILPVNKTLKDGFTVYVVSLQCGNEKCMNPLAMAGTIG